MLRHFGVETSRRQHRRNRLLRLDHPCKDDTRRPGAVFGRIHRHHRRIAGLRCRRRYRSVPNVFVFAIGLGEGKPQLRTRRARGETSRRRAEIIPELIDFAGQLQPRSRLGLFAVDFLQLPRNALLAAGDDGVAAQRDQHRRAHVDDVFLKSRVFDGSRVDGGRLGCLGRGFDGHQVLGQNLFGKTGLLAAREEVDHQGGGGRGEAQHGNQGKSYQWKFRGAILLPERFLRRRIACGFSGFLSGQNRQRTRFRWRRWTCPAVDIAHLDR